MPHVDYRLCVSASGMMPDADTTDVLAIAPRAKTLYETK
jgi:hypothetical protein